MKIVPNIFIIYTQLWPALCNSKEQPKIYPETAMLSIKQTVHIRDLTIQLSAVSAIRFHGCSMFIRKPICHVHIANLLYDLGFQGPWMYGYATVSYKRILDHLTFWPAHTVVTTAVYKEKFVWGKC